MNIKKTHRSHYPALKRFAKFTTFAISAFFIFLLAAIFIFFKANDAPILHGKLEYNIVFKENRKLDLYQPTNKIYEKNPVVVFYHGGAWIVGRKESLNNSRFNEAINTLRANGYAVVCPSYTLAKEYTTPFPNCVEDAVDAISWLKDNAQQYNFDLNNVGVMGESAGAQLALMVGFTDSHFSNKNHNINIDYIVDVYGPTDLYMLYKQQIPLMNQVYSQIKILPEFLQKPFDIPNYLFGFDPKSDSIRAIEFAKEYSPIQFVNKNIPPVLMIHGDNDRLVPVSQTLDLQELMDSLQLPYKIKILSGVDHAFFKASAEQKKEVQTMISDFIFENYN